MKYILTDSVKHLKIPSVKIEKSFFLEGELNVKIKEDLKEEEVIIISNIMTENILEFLFIVDAAKRMGAKIKRIIIPFLSYARQDKLYTRGESVSGAVICSILKSLKIPIVVFDIHSLRLRKYLKFENVSLLPLFIEELPKKDWVVISPDKGGVERAKKIAKILEAPLLIIKKVRNNHINMWLNKELPKEDVLIVDDMISSGTTILKAVKILKKKGAKNIYCISTHGLFIGGARSKLLKSGIKKIFVTNSLPIKSSKQIKVKKIEKFFK